MEAILSSTQASGTAAAAAWTLGATTATSSGAASCNPYRPKYRSPGTSRSAATSSERRPEITATTRYRITRAARTSRAPSTGRASSGLATMAESDPSQSRRMPASSGMLRRRRRLPALRAGVIAAEVDRDLDLLLHVRRAGRQARDLHVEAAEEVRRQGFGLDPVVRAAVVDRGHRDGGRRVGHLGGDVAVLLLEFRRGGRGEARDAGPVEHPDADAHDLRAGRPRRRAGRGGAGRGRRARAGAGRGCGRPALGEGLVDQDDPSHHEGDDEGEAK